MPVLAQEINQNLIWVLDKMKAFSEGEVDLICLPEMWTTDFVSKGISKLAKETANGWIKVQKEAARIRAHICGSALEEQIQSGKKSYFNTAQLVSPFIKKNHPFTNSYRKIHLFRPLDEQKNFKAGKDLIVGEVGQVLIGLSICYDLRFPELYRALARKGAQIILVPSAWPLSRKTHWKVLLQARAIENQVFVIGVNRVGQSSKGFQFAGSSLIVDPWGEILWEGSEKSQEVRIAEINCGKIPEIRKKITVWQDQRPDLYQIWLKEDF